VIRPPDIWESIALALGGRGFDRLTTAVVGTTGYVTQTARIFCIGAILMKQEIHAGPRRFYPPSLFPTSAAILSSFLQTSFFTTFLYRTISTSLALGAILVVCTFSSTSLRVDFATNCELTASHLLSLFCTETDNFALPYRSP
jgi:hypothetical protein